jgi:hypothetical protein
MQLRQAGLGYKEADEDVLRRQDRHDGGTCRHRFAGLRQHVRNTAADGRRDGALR